MKIYLLFVALRNSLNAKKRPLRKTKVGTIVDNSLLRYHNHNGKPVIRTHGVEDGSPCLLVIPL